MAKIKCGVCGQISANMAEHNGHMTEKHKTDEGGIIIIEE